MPIKSKSQMAYMGIHHPDILRRWQKEAPRKIKDLPKRVKPKRKKNQPEEATFNPKRQRDYANSIDL